MGGAWAQLSPRQTLESRHNSPTPSTDEEQENAESRQDARYIEINENPLPYYMHPGSIK